MKETEPQFIPHTPDAAEFLSALGTDPAAGLGAAAAEQRLALEGSNEIAEAPPLAPAPARRTVR